MNKEEFDYDKELEKFCKARGIWDKKNHRPTKFVINKLKTIDATAIHPETGNPYTYKQNVFDGFTTKRPRLTNCHYCFEPLLGKQRQYCSPRCSDLASKVRKQFEERSKDGAEVIWITKDPDGLPQWKNMVVRYKNGTQEPLTTKSGKQRNKRLRTFQSQ